MHVKINVNKPIYVRPWHKMYENWEDFIEKCPSHVKAETINEAIEKGNILNWDGITEF